MAKAVMGSGSVSVVNNLSGITGKFNGEKALTQLLIVDECWSKGHVAMELFKPIVSDDYVPVERKGEQLFTTRATHNTLVFSNHHIPFQSAETERRWWVPPYREYDLGEDTSKDTNQAYHAEGNRLVRNAMPLGKRGNQQQLQELLCWLKLVADMTPASFFTTAPPSIGFMDLVDIGIQDEKEHLIAWLNGLGARDAISLPQVVTAASIPQSQLTEQLTKLGFRKCQMSREGNRIGWTKAPNGVGPTELVSYST